MATSLRALRRLQVGLEAALGTPVPATSKIPGDITFTEELDKYYANYPRGVRAPVTKGGIPVRKGAMVRVEQDLSFEDLLVPLQAGLGGKVRTGLGPYVYTFTPALGAVTDVEGFTVEYAEGDGVADHVTTEFSHAFCPRMSFNWAFNEIATCSWELVGRVASDAAVTAALTEHTDREEIESNSLSVFLNDSWATLGNSQLLTIVRSGTLEIETGLTPKSTIDGRSDLDLTGINSGELTGRLSLVGELDATWETERAHWRSNDLRFIQLSVTSGTKVLTLSLACKFTSPPAFTDSGDGHTLMTMEAEIEYDPTGARAVEAVVTVDSALYAA